MSNKLKRPWSSVGSSVLIGATPRSLSVTDFAAARVSEIQNLTSVLSEASQGNRRAFQTLPKHMRRRTMSHNPRRMPVRLREIARRELEKDPNLKAKVEKQENRNRKIRRKVKNSMQVYARRAKKNKWLETHIWHAKRMHMINIWDHRIANFPNDKGIRATHRAAEICSLYDASYYACISLYGEIRKLGDMFRIITPFDAEDITCTQIGNREKSVHIFRPFLYPFGALGPVRYHWRPNNTNVSNNCLFVWIHPAALQETLDCFSQAIDALNLKSFVTVESLEADFCRFELTGSMSQIVIAAALRPKESSPNFNLFQSLRASKSPDDLPSGVIYALNIKDPAVFSPRQPFDANATRAKFDVPAPPAVLELLQSFLADWPANSAETSLWSKEKRQDLIAVAAKRKSRFFNSSKNTASKAMELEDQDDIPLLFIQQPSRLLGSDFSGYSIIVPASWGMAVWLALNFAGARSIGLRDRIQISLEQSSLHFPQYYPDSHAGKWYENFIANQLEAQYNKMPPAKRPNFQVLSIDSPFCADWNGLFPCGELLSCDKMQDAFETSSESEPDSKRVRANVVSDLQKSDLLVSFFVLRDNGILSLFRNPQPNLVSLHELSLLQPSSILLTTREVQLLPLQLSISSNLAYALVPVAIEFQQGVPSDFALLLMPSDTDIKLWAEGGDFVASSWKEKRQVIGYIAAGFYSLHRGRGYGIGFCSLVLLASLIVKSLKSNFFQIRAITRNVTSEHERQCSIHILEP